MSHTRVVRAMAMDFSVTVGALAPTLADRAIDAAHAVLVAADQTFSLWQDHSELNQLNRGELALDECGVDMREVLASCEWYRDVTGGAFDARRRDGGWDPTGLVKGWAVQRAGSVLDDAGAGPWMIGAAGDVLCSPHGPPRRIGIADPRIVGNPAGGQVVDVITLGGGHCAVATSGGANHPDHIWDPTTGQPAQHVIQVSVAGTSLVECDVFATAIAAGGIAVVEHAQRRGLEVLVVDHERTDGTFAARSTPGWPSAEAGSAAHR